MLIECDLVLIHVYHAHATYLKARLPYGFLHKEGQRVFRFGALRKALFKLGRISNPAHTHILEYDAHVLCRVLVVFSEYLVPRVNARVGAGIKIVCIESRISPYELPRLLCRQCHNVVLYRVLHEK